MPDVVGNWDRRADHPDYDPSLNEIVPGRSKRLKNEERRERASILSLKKNLIEKGYGSLFHSGYSIESGRSITVGSDGFGYVVGRVNNRGGIEIVYEHEEDNAYDYNPGIAEQNRCAYKLAQKLTELGKKFTVMPLEFKENLDKTISRLEIMLQKAKETQALLNQ